MFASYYPTYCGKLIICYCYFVKLFAKLKFREDELRCLHAVTFLTSKNEKERERESRIKQAWLSRNVEKRE